jgi:hypothetical protein
MRSLIAGVDHAGRSCMVEEIVIKDADVHHSTGQKRGRQAVTGGHPLAAAPASWRDGSQSHPSCSVEVFAAGND